MKVLWLSWKDLHHPLSGGAEVAHDSILSHLVGEGHDVTLLTSSYKDAQHEDEIHGYKVVRVGGKYSVYWQAYKYYKTNLQDKNFDLIVEEVNTIPFFSKFYAKEKKMLFFHQLAREIWFYQMFFPLSLIGYIIEPIYLWLLRKMEVITISISTQNDLMRFGFKKDNISIISEGVGVPPIDSLDTSVKADNPTILSIGSVRPMKRTLHIVKAFEKAEARMPSLKLIIAGDASGTYGQRVARLTARSPFSRDIKLVGHVTDDEKSKLMTEAHVIAVTSVKEGWGLIVTEAGRRGTPAVVYNVDGLRDSVQDGVSGLISRENNPQSLSLSITELLSKPEYYKGIRKNAYELSKKITFEKQYEDFKIAIGIDPQPERLSTL